MIGELLSLSAAFCWAVSPVLYRKALAKVSDPVVVNLVRCTLVLPVLVIALFLTGNFSSLFKINWTSLSYLSVGVLIAGGLGDSFYYMSLKRIGAARGTSISYSAPLFAVLFAGLILAEPVGAGVALGAALVVLGTWLVSRNITGRGSEAHESIKGVTAAILAATSWSLGMVFYKPAVTDAGPYVAAVVRMIVLTMFVALVVAVTRRSHMLKDQSIRTWLMLGAAGLIDLGLGGTLFLVSLTMVDASKAIPLSFTSPLFATILAFALLHEKVTWRVALGATLIVMGTWAITIP